MKLGIPLRFKPVKEGFLGTQRASELQRFEVFSKLFNIMDRLTGIHAVREALEANKPLDSLIVARGTHGNRIEELVRLARQYGIPVRFEERVQVDRAAGTREHQGVVALVAASPAASFEDLLKPRDPLGAPGLVVLLDGVEDPHNLG